MNVLNKVHTIEPSMKRTRKFGIRWKLRRMLWKPPEDLSDETLKSPQTDRQDNPLSTRMLMEATHWVVLKSVTNWLQCQSNHSELITLIALKSVSEVCVKSCEVYVKSYRSPEIVDCAKLITILNYNSITRPGGCVWVKPLKGISLFLQIGSDWARLTPALQRLSGERIRCIRDRILYCVHQELESWDLESWKPRTFWSLECLKCKF